MPTTLRWGQIKPSYRLGVSQRWGQIRPSHRHPAASQVGPLQAALLGPIQTVTAMVYESGRELRTGVS